MILVHDTNAPQLLLDNQLLWTADLINLIKKYGGYDNIPKEEKDITVNKYRQPEIQEAVIAKTFGKCVFCESPIETTSYSHVEHFHPKSLFPKQTFLWSNLYPSCAKCNLVKGMHNTKQNPMVHPFYDDGEEYFSYGTIKIDISRTAPDRLKAQRTIDKCDLWRPSLFRIHANLLCAFYETEIKLKDEIEHYSSLIQAAAKARVASNLKESLDNLHLQAAYDKPYAGFMRYIIKTSSIINEIVVIINHHKNDLGLVDDFKWEWS